MRRFTTALVATISALLLSLTLAPANAGTTLDRERVTPAGAERQAPLPPHDVRRLKAQEIRNTGRFFVKGKALSYKGRKVVLQKANRKAGPYRVYKRERTRKRDGFFRISFDGKIGTHWRIVVPRTNWARATKIYVGRIIRG